MGFFDFGAREAEIKSETFVDPSKKAVADPLSRFLAGQIGQGVPRFETPERLQEGESRVSDFLSLDPSEFFTEKVEKPSVGIFKDELFPLVREEFAGRLLGSGRLKTEEQAVSQFTRGLAGERAKFETEIPQAQARLLQQERAFVYNDWLKSLPQYNPALGQALQFLQQSTSSGTDVVTALDPGTEGWFGDLLGAVATIGGAGIGAGFGQGVGGIFESAASKAGRA